MSAPAGGEAAGGRGDARASTRVRKASAAMAYADAETRLQAAAARLDALENDNAAAEGGGGDDSDDYVLADDLEGAGPAGTKRKRGAKRTTRGAVAERKGPKPLSALLEEARLELLPPGVPSYLRAAVGPPRAALQRRKFCSVCGFQAPYTCPRCGMRFCSRKCSGTHAETRCLRFTV